MARVRSSNGDDPRGVAGRREPVSHRCANPSARDWRITGPRVSGDQEHHPLFLRDRLLEPAVDGAPRSIEIVSVQVDHPVRRQRAVAKTPVPASVEVVGNRRTRRRRRGWCRTLPEAALGGFRRRRFLRLGLRRLDRCLSDGFPGKRADGRGDSRPQRLFVSAERAHLRRRLSAGAPMRVRSRTCRRRCASPARPHPRRCRTGWSP